MIYCFSTHADSIRTIPALQHDSARPEDVNTESEDHAADEWRYACMSRMWTRPKPNEVDTSIRTGFGTLADLVKRHDARKGHRERI